MSYVVLNMIQADIHGKTGVPEDVLTSCCLGLLHLFPDDNLIELLSLAKHLDGHRIDLSGVDTVRELEFWPWLRDGGVPDAIATLVSSLKSRPMKIVIEVKHGAGKSGEDEDDQLARYYSAATRHYKEYEVFLIYLTHHRDMPTGDLEASLAHLTRKAQIYWLSWYNVAKWTSDKLHKTQSSTAEFRILCTINSYLSSKGYERFNELKTVPRDAIKIKPLYTRGYISLDAMGFVLCCSQLYKRLYVNQQVLSDIPIVFKH